MPAFRHWIFAVTFLCGTLSAQETPSFTNTVKSDVKAMNEAVINGKYERLADLTHPSVLKIMGGRDNMIAFTKREMEAMKSKGFGFESVTVGEPGEKAVNGSQTFVVVPFELKLKLPDGVAYLPSFVIGVSNDNGKSWVYVNGDIEIEKVKSILPNLPESLKIPAKTQPRIVKD